MTNKESALQQQEGSLAQAPFVRSVAGFLSGDDPLSLEALAFLADYEEEDEQVDYKQTFDPSDEKHWLALTVDVMALANTLGGYLVYGVVDGTYEKVGVTGEVRKALTDSNKVMQKINRHIEPDIALLRSKSFKSRGKDLVAVFVPRSVTRTHMVARDGSYTRPSGEKKTAVRKGTFYIRRVAGNHLADSRDLEDVVGRRLDLFRESLIGKLGVVVAAPPESDVFIARPDPTSDTEARYIIDDATDALPARGMSFTVAPSTPEQSIAAWTAMSGKNPKVVPPESTLWEWYAARDEIQVDRTHRLAVARFGLILEVPVFYWIRGCPAKDIKEMLISVATSRPLGTTIGNVVGLATFLGERFHRSLIRQLGDYVDRLAPRRTSFPVGGPRTLFDQGIVDARRRCEPKFTGDQLRASLKNELDSIAAEMAGLESSRPDYMQRWTAQAIDCHLYAQDDKYVGSASKRGHAPHN